MQVKFISSEARLKAEYSCWLLIGCRLVTMQIDSDLVLQKQRKKAI